MAESNLVTLGLIQMSCADQPQQNLDQAINRLMAAREAGAQIACLQELFLTPYFCQDNNEAHFALAETVPGPTTEALGKVAREQELVIVASLFERDGEHFYNTACVLDADGRYLGKYRKVHIPDDPSNYYSERFYFSPGDLGFPVFATRYATIGLQICWDQWFPEGARALAMQGAEFIFYPTAIGWQLAQKDTELGPAETEAWLTVQRGHAIANGVFVAACNRTGREGHIDFWGRSFVADPLGRILATAPADENDNLIVACDLGRIAEVRKDWPFLTARRADTYQEK